MERIPGLLLAVFLLNSVAIADTILAPAQPDTFSATEPGQEFPESRFGQPAAPAVDMGVSKGYASRAVTEMDADTTAPTNTTQPSRSPAGLVYANAPAAQPQTQTSQPEASPKLYNVESGFNKETQQTLPSPVSETSRKGVQEVALIAGDLGFFPKTVFVTRDVPVRLFVTGASKNTLCIMMDSFQVKKQIRSQKIEEITFTPATPGKYRFYCPVNGMEGTMIVKELASTVAVNNNRPSGE